MPFDAARASARLCGLCRTVSWLSTLPVGTASRKTSTGKIISRRIETFVPRQSVEADDQPHVAVDKLDARDIAVWFVDLFQIQIADRSSINVKSAAYANETRCGEFQRRAHGTGTWWSARHLCDASAEWARRRIRRRLWISCP